MTSKILPVLFACLFVFGTNQAYSQALVEASLPPVTTLGTSANRAPNGTTAHTSFRAHFIIPASEASVALANGTLLKRIGFMIETGTNTPAGGQLKIYLQNTASTTNQKSTTWATAISDMTEVYDGVYNLPVGGTATNVFLNLPTPFAYTGGGLYVAYDYLGSTFATTAVVYSSDQSLTSGLYNGNSASTTPPTVLNSVSSFRPRMLFSYDNPYSNDISVTAITQTFGNLSRLWLGQHSFTATVRNTGSLDKSNISVQLAVTGANAQTLTQVIPSLLAGESTTVTFTPNFSNAGNQVLTVSVPADQNNTNNSKTINQAIACDVIRYAGNDTPYDGIGFNTGAGIMAARYTAPLPIKVSAVKVRLSNNASSIGKIIRGVVLDNSGAIVASSADFSITAGNSDTEVAIPLLTPVNINSGDNFFMGIAQTSGSPGYFPVGTTTPTNPPLGIYVTFVPTGGIGSNVANLGNLMIGAVAEAQLTLSSSATGTLKYGQNAIFTAGSGFDSYNFKVNGISKQNTAGNTFTYAPKNNDVVTVEASKNGCAATSADSFTMQVIEPLPTAGVLFVKKGGTGDGSSWTNPLGELADALLAAKVNTSVNQIWVAAGTYKPLYSPEDGTNFGTDQGRNNAFLLVKDVKLYGGFAGTETTVAQRNLGIAANTSMLSGDLDGNDDANGTQTGNNAYHVIAAAGLSNTTLDGFTVIGGNADHSGASVTIASKVLSTANGGGMYTSASVVNLNQVIFKANLAKSGAAIYNETGSALISNALISGNKADKGAGIYNNNGDAYIVNSTLSGNHAMLQGGGLFNELKGATLVNTIVYGNSSAIEGLTSLVSNSTIEGGYAGTANHSGDPLFEDMPAFNTAPFVTGNYKLKAGSPARDAGDNTKTIGSANNQVPLNQMADQLQSSSCSGLLCSVVNPALGVSNTSYTDYALLNIPVGLLGVLGTAELGLGWSATNGKSGDYVGFVIAPNNQALNTTLLGNIKIELLDAGGAVVGSQIGFTTAEDIILDGQMVKQIGFVAPADFSRAKIHLTQLVGLLTSVRVLGAYIIKPSLSETLLTDIISQPRIFNQATGGVVDQGAYEMQSVSQTINPIADVNKTYGDADFEMLATATSGLQVAFASADNSIAEAYQDAADGNKWKVKVKKTGTVNVTASQVGDANFLPATNVVFALTVNAKPLTINLTNAALTKVYDANSNGTLALANLTIAQGGIVGADDVQLSLSSNTFSYDNKDAGTAKAITFPIAAISLTGTASGNYSIANVTELTATIGTITPAPLTVKANNASKVYDGFAYNGGNGVNYSGFALGESQLDLAGTLNYGGTSQGAINTGSYSIEPSGLSATNYAITYQNGTLSVSLNQTNSLSFNSQAPGTSVSKTYGDAVLNAAAVANSGLTANYQSSNSGVASIDATGQVVILGTGTAQITASQPGDSNYGPANNISFTLVVSKKDLTVKANDASKTFDGLPYNGGNGITFTGFVPTEDHTVIAGLPAYTGNSQGAIDVGNYQISPSGLSAANYNLIYVAGTLSIVQSGNNVLTFEHQTSGGILNLSYGAGLLNAKARASSGLPVSYLSSNPTVAHVDANGSVQIIGPGTAVITANQAGNINHAAANPISFTIQVQKAPLTISANNANKVYDNIAYQGGNGINFNGFVNGENENSLQGSLVFAGTAQGAKNVGSYFISPGGYSSANYAITYQDGSLTIGKAVLTVTADHQSRCVGQPNPTFTLNYSGFRNGDGESSISTKPTVSTTANSSSAAGNYVLVPGSGTALNYNFDYINGNLTVNALPSVSITSSKGTSISKGDALSLTAIGGISYSWATANGITGTQSSAVLNIRPSQTSTYTVTVTNSNGCSSSQNITIQVAEDYKLTATNLLTPNNDGTNDKWIVDNIDMYPNNEVRIFDRAGRLLYTKHGYDNSWDGTVNGQALAEGTYYYLIDYGKDKLKQKGFITLIREGR